MVASAGQSRRSGNDNTQTNAWVRRGADLRLPMDRHGVGPDGERSVIGDA